MNGPSIAYVLAGGQSRRMGRDKLFVEFEGSRILEKTLWTCRQHFQQIVIVAKDALKFSSIDCDVVIDADGFAGPIAGVIAALRDCEDASCFITAADLADLSTETIELLKQGYSNEDYFGILERGHVQPLCGIYGAAALPQMEEVASRGVTSMRDALVGLQMRYLEAPSKWRNLNSPADLVAG